jgi:putative membrane protein
VSPGDPRVFFAAERTLLAWVRSGLTVMALGFVVARFGLFLELISASSAAPAAGHQSHWLSSLLGIILVVVGAGTILAALQNHRAYVRVLPAADVPTLPFPWLTTFMAGVVAVAGFLLAVYLAVA